MSRLTVFDFSVLFISGLLAACGGDDGTSDIGFPDTGTPPGDSSAPDTSTPDSSTSDAGLDAAPDTSTTDTGVADSAMTTDSGMLLACTLEELTPIFECASTACLMLPDASLPDVSISLDAGLPDVSLPDASLPDPGELATCILLNCGTLVFGVSSDCRGCLLAGVGMDLDEIRMSCAPGLAVP